DDGGGGLGVRSGRGVFFDGHAKFVKGAVVAGVFGGDAFRNGLGAFKLRAGVEETALLTTMQVELALGALAVGIEAGGEDGAAVGAAGARDGANHARGARTVLIGAARAAGGRFLVVRALTFFTFFR